MTAKQKLIFATKADYTEGFRRMESQHKMTYVHQELQEEPTPTTWSLGESIDNLGELRGKRVSKPGVLVTLADSPLRWRAIPQKRGGERYIFDMVANPDSVLLELGGMMGDCLIYGGAQGDPDSGLVWRTFDRYFLAGFTKKRSYWLGPEALKLFRQGVRLTSSPKAEPSMDLAERT